MKSHRIGGRGGKRKFVVTTRTEPYGPFERFGTVVLRDKASEDEVEAALSAIGIYAPRGNDILRWGNAGATIQDVQGGTTRLAKVGTGQPRETLPKRRKRRAR
jgi:hypothetical protein